MIFSNLTFIFLFLPLLFLLYYPVKSIKWKNIILIIFSVIFYCWAGAGLFLLMLACIVINYTASLIISHFNDVGNYKLKKAVLILSIICDIGILFVFKYLGLFGKLISLIPSVNLDFSGIVLPVGISFFTFQAMSYTIDVYRGDVPAQKKFYKLLLYISLFPQLIAGPIVRYKDIAEQIDKRTVTLEKIGDGAYRFAIGLAKKVIIANGCGSAVKALLDSSPESSTVLSAWLGAAFFALQIYFDFSGYSDMAIGLGSMFGFKFKENFNYPYISDSATDFWRRWHISLGTFFRDYLYIPLGGNRSHWLRNVIIVWLLTGLWHGASLNFVLWGAFYALLLIIEKKLLKPLMKNCNKILKRILSVIYMIPITLFGWTIFYYTEGLPERIKIMFGIGHNFADVYEANILRSYIFLLVIAIICATPLLPFIFKKIENIFSRKSRYTFERIMKTVFILCSLTLSTVMLVGNTYNPFLYFRF